MIRMKRPRTDRMPGRRGTFLRAPAVAALLVGVIAIVTGDPGRSRADTHIPLPGGAINRTLADGTAVSLHIDGESATINPSLGDTPLHRNVWVSGRGVVDVSGPKAHQPGLSIKLYPGYIVGCQVSIGGLNSGVVEAYTPHTTARSAGTLQSTFAEALTIGPGQAQALYILDLEQPDDYHRESHKQYTQVIGGPHSSVTWGDETFAIDGCAGAATARSFIAADVATDNTESMVTLWGEPFSMG
ncbi:hypothetical protein ABIA39_008041 [Nocardia sp. GAS34]